MPLISYPVDSAIQPLNNQSLGTTLAPRYRERCHGDCHFTCKNTKLTLKFGAKFRSYLSLMILP